tara:strand:- start:6199 stop:6420 length:222 start_codon:yes stop_codon:yes gene_type:complete
MSDKAWVLYQKGGEYFSMQRIRSTLKEASVSLASVIEDLTERGVLPEDIDHTPLITSLQHIQDKITRLENLID